MGSICLKSPYTLTCASIPHPTTTLQSLANTPPIVDILIKSSVHIIFFIWF
ncbi:MAG: hypothetical protein WCL02_03010 [bacterium]